MDLSNAKISKPIRLSVIVIFYNMRREAKRTLFSLTREYQKNINNLTYEVIAIDNGSPEPLDGDFVRGMGENFRYVYFDTTIPSPCEALNYGAEISHGDYLMLCIDGARILSPGVLHLSTLASNMFRNPFIYTLGMHIGDKPQNYLVEEGYSQPEEDKLFESVDWKTNGYSLFDISSLAFSSKKGFFSKITESNCVTLLKSTYTDMGGFDEKFTSLGGGLTNLDFFNRVNQTENIDPVMLLGEATFHQFHGGTATNVSISKHPWNKMVDEYVDIRGKPFEFFFKPPTYFGQVNPHCSSLLTANELEQKLSFSNKQVISLQGEIKAIRNSYSWKVAFYIRKTLTFLIPRGSGREKFVHWIRNGFS